MVHFLLEDSTRLMDEMMWCSCFTAVYSLSSLGVSSGHPGWQLVKLSGCWCVSGSERCAPACTAPATLSAVTACFAACRWMMPLTALRTAGRRWWVAAEPHPHFPQHSVAGGGRQRAKRHVSFSCIPLLTNTHPGIRAV